MDEDCGWWTNVANIASQVEEQISWSSEG